MQENLNFCGNFHAFIILCIRLKLVIPELENLGLTVSWFKMQFMNADGKNADVDIGFPLCSFSFSILSKSTFNYCLPRPVLLFSLTSSLPTYQEDIAVIHCVLQSLRKAIAQTIQGVCKTDFQLWINNHSYLPSIKGLEQTDHTLGSVRFTKIAWRMPSPPTP